MEPLDLLMLLVRKLEELQLSYFVTGSMATITYGEPRFTNDIDVVIALKPEDTGRFCAAFPMPDFYVSSGAVADAIRDRRQFNIIHPASGLKVDVIVSKADDFETSRHQRARLIPVTKDVEIRFAAPEDVILRKMQYFREGGSDKHLRDIASVLKLQGDRIDFNYIAGWIDRLGVRDVWDLVMKQHGPRSEATV